MKKLFAVPIFLAASLFVAACAPVTPAAPAAPAAEATAAPAAEATVEAQPRPLPKPPLSSCGSNRHGSSSRRSSG